MMETKHPKIILVDHGVANHFGKYIEINRELLGYPILYDYILKHEINHTQKDFSLEDLKNEFRVNYKMVWELFKFVAARPRLWYEFLPIYRREKVWHVDYVMSALYLISITLLLALLAILSFL